MDDLTTAIGCLCEMARLLYLNLKKQCFTSEEAMDIVKSFLLANLTNHNKGENQ